MKEPGRIQGRRPARRHAEVPAARIRDRRSRRVARLAPRKRPRQERSRATFDAILEAAIDLLSSRGYAQTSTNQIAARAGVSVGSLYQYFPNKDAIVTTLFERHARDIGQIVNSAFADMRLPEMPIREAFHRLLVGFDALHAADPRVARALDPEVEGHPQLAEAARQGEEGFRLELAELLRQRPDVRRGNHAIMASLLFEIVEAVTRSLMHGHATRFERSEALREATEAICRYIEA